MNNAPFWSAGPRNQRIDLPAMRPDWPRGAAGRGLQDHAGYDGHLVAWNLK